MATDPCEIPRPSCLSLPRMNGMNELIELAQVGDSPEIAALVNKAYRPESDVVGWTHESALVAGDRTSSRQVENLFRQDSFVLVMKRNGEVVACVHVELADNGCWIGMLATLPADQNSGVGKRMLLAAEASAIEHFTPKRLMMSVLSSRPELLSFYQRRGYQLTGQVSDYPREVGVGTPLSKELKVLALQKLL